MVQWLRLLASNARMLDLIPGQELDSICLNEVHSVPESDTTEQVTQKSSHATTKDFACHN